MIASEDPITEESLKQAKKRQHADYIDWLDSITVWSSMITLTFKEPVTAESAKRWFSSLIRVLNEDVFGDHYTKIRGVGHSYFSYICGMEYQIREVVHFHVLVDRPVNYQLIHKWWGLKCGFAFIKPVVADTIGGAVRYVTKYVCKGGDENIDVWINLARRDPRCLPNWWVVKASQSNSE